MTAPAERLRRGRPEEATAIADLMIRSRRAAIPAIPPPVHPDAEARVWFARTVMPSQEVWVIESDGELVAMMALSEAMIEQLYVHPDHTGRGLGSQLVELAKRRRSALSLWTFAANLGARRFYERHGFVAVAGTNGDNEEGAPDVRYAWPGRAER